MTPSNMIKWVIIATVVGGLAYLGYLYIYKPAAAVYNYTSPQTQVSDITKLAQEFGLTATQGEQIGSTVTSAGSTFLGNLFGPIAPIVEIPANAILHTIGF